MGNIILSRESHLKNLLLLFIIEILIFESCNFLYFELESIYIVYKLQAKVLLSFTCLYISKTHNSFEVITMFAISNEYYVG